MTMPHNRHPHSQHEPDAGAVDPATPSTAFWESHYAALDTAWGTEPNAVLVDTFTDLALPPGRALDLGAGHGGDALWLASWGWRVTAVDVSATALRRVSDAAERAGWSALVSVEQHDLTATFPPGEFDLVSACYFHTPLPIDRSAVLRRAARRVAVGGLLVVVEHASTPPWSWGHGHDQQFPTAQQSLDDLGLEPSRWRTALCCSPERTASGPDGQRATVTENVIMVRRRV